MSNRLHFVPKHASRRIRQSDGTVTYIMPAGGDIGGGAFNGTHTSATGITSDDTRVRAIMPHAYRRPINEIAAAAS